MKNLAMDPRRMAGTLEGDFVVFLIGMRINRWWKPQSWLSVGSAMPKMLKELYAHPELGMLASESWFGRTTLLLSYWRSMDHLLDYAKKRDSEHLPAWRAFNKKIGSNGDVGIWHETYAVKANAFEGIYVNMPAFGLAKAGDRVPAIGHRKGAKSRLGRGEADHPVEVEVQAANALTLADGHGR